MQDDFPFEGPPTPYAASRDHLLDTARFYCWAAEHVQQEEGFPARFHDGLRHIVAREALTDGIELRLKTLSGRFGLTAYEELCVALALAAELCAAADGVFRRQTGTGLPNHWLALSLYAQSGQQPDNVFCALAPEAPLSYLCRRKTGADSVLSEPFALHIDTLRYLTEVPLTGAGHLSLDTHPSPGAYLLYEPQAARLSAFLGEYASKALCINVYGGEGKRTLVQRACRQAGYGVVFAEGLERVETEECLKLGRRLVGLCRMTNSRPVIHTGRETGRGLELLAQLPEELGPVFLCSETGVTATGRETLPVELPPLTRAERLGLWESAGLSADTLADFRLSPGQVNRVAASVSALRAFGDTGGEASLVVREVGRLNTHSGLARIFPPAFTLDDIVVSDPTRQLILQICQTIRHRARLFEEWGYGALYPYGRGVGALFHGVSGTGKTMAVQVIARELGLSVMAADLARISDKYIGETEKNLTEIFEAAAQNNCILFFDEADALFAKRTDVSDSLDRHANSQTAHLLQKMEEYDGPVILATNLFENVDDAFRRRLPFVVEFERPDAALRRTLWQKFFPPGAPCDGLDFDFLAETYPLTPAVMKWSALSAGVRAINEGRSITMADVLDALRYEYKKMNLAFPESEWNTVVL